ncbi:hypothetical protein H8356DRAFT_1337198 [Neocallimastix lanati (nom. inval.)]|nr:hypothetical protein H8356DRAFT_1337198 [Neocallimastix sp. JGI-2020a]
MVYHKYCRSRVRLEIWWALPAQLSGRAIDCRSIGLRDSNTQPSALEADALPLRQPSFCVFHDKE